MKATIQESKKYTLSVYNHAAGRFETVEVTEEVYRTYQRTEWNIDDNDASFYGHEIQFSSLIGGSEDTFQNFREFIDSENTPEKVIEEKVLIETLLEAIATLGEKDFELIQALYFDGTSEAMYAKKKGVTQQMISKKKQRILKKIKNILDGGL